MTVPVWVLAIVCFFGAYGIMATLTDIRHIMRLRREIKELDVQIEAGESEIQELLTDLRENIKARSQARIARALDDQPRIH